MTAKLSTRAQQWSQLAACGGKGFDKQIWDIQTEPTGESTASATLTYVSRAGEENDPGTLTMHVTYTLTETNEPRIHYQATTDADTALNLTNQSGGQLFRRFLTANESAVAGRPFYKISRISPVWVTRKRCPRR